MSEKKVIAVIVEGPSDEAALGSVLKEYFSNDEVRFAIVHGDITTRDGASKDTILRMVNDEIEGVKKKYGYDTEDFLKIIHIVDTDGAFCKDVIVEADIEDVQYYRDRIETKHPAYLEKKHLQKAEVLFKLYSSNRVNSINYKVYFNSCNLEDVLWGELKAYTDEEKEELADDFADKYEGKIEEFIAFISQKEVAVPGSFRQTWRFIEKDKHSLERFSNMHLIFK